MIKILWSALTIYLIWSAVSTLWLFPKMPFFEECVTWGDWWSAALVVYIIIPLVFFVFISFVMGVLALIVTTGQLGGLW